MDAMTRAAPPPGSAQAGDLYVDLQSRSLWLGVDPAVDPAGFVLISDIVKLMEEIEISQIESKVYTDQQIATRAPTTHTHTSTQITDFNAAVTAVASSIPGISYTRGMVMMYSGSLADIGVGPLAGWALCDGANGTPDLRDRFVLAAGSRIVGSKNPNASFFVDPGGAHSHTINNTVISHAQMPYHNHGGNTGYISHNHQHYVSGGTDGQGNHQHGCSQDGWPIPSSGGWSLRAAGASTARYLTSVAGYHGHNFGAWTGGVSENHYHGIPAEGGNVGHNHTVVGGGGIHSDHSVTSAQLRETLPFYALAFIMKL
jgi:hypothetical protein